MNKLNHIAIIMDGNGRWAQKRNLERSEGHKAGEETVKMVIENCYKMQIPYLSLFAFSTENWAREEKEVKTLFQILSVFLKKFLSEAIKREIRIKIMGDMSKLPKKLQTSLKDVIDKTKDFERLTVNIGLNYGGRDEIVYAVRNLVEKGENITKENISKNLYTSDLPDPDLCIRTSGEMRMSNFMIYQCAYSELYFTDVLWPDFSQKDFMCAIEEYNRRNRRFGKA